MDQQADHQLIAAIEQLNRGKVLKLVRQRLAAGRDPVYLQEQVRQGMVKVGLLYEKGEYFIADLIMAGKIFKDVLKLILIQPDTEQAQKIGRILLGTVKGDLHDIGKDIFASMAEGAGFEVYDLGIDVPPEAYVEKARQMKPDIVAMSGILTVAVESMKETVEALTSAGLRDQVKIIIGGIPVNERACRYVGADAFATQASDGVEICVRWAKAKGTNNPSS